MSAIDSDEPVPAASPELVRGLEEAVRERTSELEHERARLQAVLEHLPLGVVIADAPSGRTTMGNRQAVQLALGSTATLGGFHPDGSEYAADEWPLARSLSTGEIVKGELIEIVRADGSETTHEVSSAPIRDESGAIVAAVATFQDVSERERLERAEREFVTNAAHELRTPLAAIVSAVEVLQSGAKESPEQRDLFLGHIERECNRLGRLAQALLVLARAQVGVEAPQRGLVELRPLLEDVAAGLNPPPGVELELDCDQDIVALTNRQLVEQAVLALGSNAARHTARGHIRLAARRLDATVVIEVEDTGAGIDKDDLARVYRRFNRGTGPRGDGFGLGLAIVEQSARALGGSLELASEAGRGTTARFTIPSAQLARVG